MFHGIKKTFSSSSWGYREVYFGFALTALYNAKLTRLRRPKDPNKRMTLWYSLPQQILEEAKPCMGTNIQLGFSKGVLLGALLILFVRVSCKTFGQHIVGFVYILSGKMLDRSHKSRKEQVRDYNIRRPCIPPLVTKIESEGGYHSPSQ